MNAKLSAVAHYQSFEAHAREVAKAQATIRELRGELSAVIREIQRTASAIKDVDALIVRVRETLARTQDAAPLVGREAGTSASSLLPAGGDAFDLDVMSKPQRKSELVACISDMFGVKARP